MDRDRLYVKFVSKDLPADYFANHTNITVRHKSGYHYRQTFRISHTKPQHLNVSHIVLQFSLPTQLKPHLNDHQFFCMLWCAVY